MLLLFLHSTLIAPHVLLHNSVGVVLYLTFLAVYSDYVKNVNIFFLF